MNSLQELCYAHIASTVETAPPFLQEKVMGETRKRIKENMKDDVKKEVMPEAKKMVQGEICNVLPYIFPDIIDDIIGSMINPGRIRRNYRKELVHLPSEVVECAILIAENSVNILDDHYTRREFALRQNNYFSFFGGEEEYSDQDSDRDSEENYF